MSVPCLPLRHGIRSLRQQVESIFQEFLSPGTPLRKLTNRLVGKRQTIAGKLDPPKDLVDRHVDE